MSKSIRLSIIMPAYNVESYISSAIKSIIRQTFADWELIIVNDGSNDGTLSICENYASKDSRIKVYTKENGGVASARNYGLDRIHGEYITFVDSDDEVLDNETYMTVIKALDENPRISLVQYRCFRVTKSGKVINDFYNGEHSLILDDKKQFFERVESISDYLKKPRSLSSGNCDKIFRRELFDNLRYKEGMVFEDTFLSVQIFNRADSILLIPKGAYGYYIRENSITTKKRTIKAYQDQLNSQLGMLEGLIVNRGEKDDIKIVVKALKKFIIGIYVRHGLSSNLSAELKRLNHLCTMANLPQYNHLIIKVSAVAHSLVRILKFSR